MNPEALKKAYDLAELENSNLRKCLAWAGALLTLDQRKELAKRIRSPLDFGGVTRDGAEDRWEENRRTAKLCVRAAELIRVAIKAPDHDALDMVDWFAKAEEVASRLMEYDPPADEASLAEIRNVEMIEKESKK